MGFQLVKPCLSQFKTHKVHITQNDSSTIIHCLVNYNIFRCHSSVQFKHTCTHTHIHTHTHTHTRTRQNTTHTNIYRRNEVASFCSLNYDDLTTSVFERRKMPGIILLIWANISSDKPCNSNTDFYGRKCGMCAY